jgi:predicted TIM-barrel fold metal-dependent hydrolase
MENQAMKVIDAHTHFPGTSFGALPKSGDEIREKFTSEGLTGAWIMTTDGLLGESARHNDLLAEGVRDHLDFFVPFCTVWPNEGADAALAELDRCAGDLGMRGLKLHPWLQGFSLTHPAVGPILKRSGELGLPVLFHDGTPPYCTPLQIAAAAEKAPETTVILGHSGLEDLYEDAILACLRHDNIHLCLCSQSAGNIQEIVRRCPADRLLFGTDAGFVPNLIEPAIARMLDLDIPEETLKKIFYKNAQTLLPYD